ncbi:MAG: hypothetical protein SVW57_09280 [Thermodesulfobacteriota bacterium]|nr:hypothetical protein [Thermodesulfobacteriota bacterium]
MLKCPKCGKTGTRVEFPYVAQAQSIGPDTYRKCPECGEFVYCDGIEEDEKMEGPPAWGMSQMWQKKFSKKDKV